MGLILGKGEKVVFIGDSITDCGRREIPLGAGYVRMAAGMIAARYPELGLEMVNVGVGGDTVKHLEARWEEDVIAQRPGWLSVSIGINDVWRQMGTKPNPTAVLIDEFEETYRRLIAETKEKTKAKLILMETTVIDLGEEDRGNRLLGPYNEVIRKLAKEFKTVLVPTNQRWQEITRRNPKEKWTSDGVHPTAAGHGVMARAWLEAVGYEWS